MKEPAAFTHAFSELMGEYRREQQRIVGMSVRRMLGTATDEELEELRDLDERRNRYRRMERERATTVADLIGTLSALDPDLPVKRWGRDESEWLSDVWVDEDGEFGPEAVVG